MPYIYKIENNINHKMYIGKTRYNNPEKRWKEHQREATRERSQHRALYRAIKKYGVENFTFTVIEETDNPEEREIYYIQLYNTFHFGYNETIGGDGAAYLQLPEQDICKYYINHSLEDTANYFNCDISTIKKILYKNNIKLRNASERMILATSYAVAKVDPVTNEIIEIYPSLSVAEKENGNTKHISEVIKGKRKTCKGFKWVKI